MCYLHKVRPPPASPSCIAATSRPPTDATCRTRPRIVPPAGGRRRPFADDGDVDDRPTTHPGAARLRTTRSDRRRLKPTKGSKDREIELQNGAVIHTKTEIDNWGARTACEVMKKAQLGVKRKRGELGRRLDQSLETERNAELAVDEPYAADFDDRRGVGPSRFRRAGSVLSRCFPKNSTRRNNRFVF